MKNFLVNPNFVKDSCINFFEFHLLKLPSDYEQNLKQISEYY